MGAKITMMTAAAPADMTPADLQALGRGAVGYIRRYRMKGQAVFVLHAADGAALSAQHTPAAAREAAVRQDLEIVKLH